MTETKPKSRKPSEHITRSILHTVRVTPGIRGDALSKEVAIHDSTLSVAGRTLCKQGRLVRKRIGRYFHYYLPEHVDVTPEVKLMIPADIVELAELDAIREELESLRAEVKDLRAFKERALVVHPDLGVDPLVLEAREIAIELMPQERHAINNGHYDNQPEVLGPLLALRRAKGIT